MVEDVEVQRLIQLWQQHLEAGKKVAIEDLCPDRPELLQAVRQHLLASTMKGLPDTTATGEKTIVSSGDCRIELLTVYHRLGLHAKGGLGEVYLAQDPDLGRQVAVKFLKTQHLDLPEVRQQFRLEAEVTGQLDHPGVVPIYGCGQLDRQPFYVMRFVSGGTLAATLKEFQPAPTGSALKRLVGHLRSACETVAYAHSRGIVHCDLKPGNILLGKYGETLVADWGSAVPVERDEQARATGEKTVRAIKSGEMSTASSSTRPWTPAYMSPEQIPGSPFEISPASDIYSLGATLYHVITGQTHVHDLFAGGPPSEEELFDWIRQAKAPRPRQLRRDIPPALEAICLKAMAVKPADRYRSALELAQDLEAWRTDGRVSVYRPPLMDRILRGARQHRAITGLTILLLLVGLALGIVGSAWYRESARVESLRAEAAHQRAETEHQRLQEAVTTSARLAAEMLAYEIDLRWHMLEREANEPRLRREMERLPANLTPSTEPPVPALQEWLADRFRASTHFNTHSWMVADAQGILVARIPTPKTATLGRSYRFRDYFHGLGKDFKEDDPQVATLKPIRAAHRSIAYRSASDDQLLVNFTVPIAGSKNDGEPAVIGVLGMTQSVAHLASLERILARGHEFLLVDLRPTPLVEPPQAGLVLHHPLLKAHLKAAGGKLVFLSSESLNQVQTWYQQEFRRCAQPGRSELETGSETGKLEPQPCRLSAWRDPLRPAESDWAAVMMPVFVRGRGLQGNFQDTGLIVIVQCK
jgi:serine/threonine protein kinase